LLEPLRVINPFAPQLTFAHQRARQRRDHEKYLTLIDAMTLLHQHQRTILSMTSNQQPLRYVLVDKRDIELVNRLAQDLFGRSLDELPPQTRTLLERLHPWVIEQASQQRLPISALRFTRRQMCRALGIGQSQASVHLTRLVELEYLRVHRCRDTHSYQYELLDADLQQTASILPTDLLDSGQLRHPSSYAALAAPATDRMVEPPALTPENFRG
jgi:PAS domain-containing protein